MANRFVNPLPQFEDSAGTPYTGGQLFFYASGTSTKLNTYSNAALTIANTNPVVLDSAGRLPNAVFLQNLQYKVVLAPSTDSDPPTSPIWTQDPVYTSDYSAAAKFTSGSGSPNGVVAGTAGSTTILADSYWDFTNKILYICTTTGNAASAVWTAINASTAAAVIPAPQGRLTPVSGTPVINADSSAATSVFYTPYIGNLCPIWNGSSFQPTVFTEQTLTLNSSFTANNIYDVFMFNNVGVPTVVIGPSWSAGTSGSITAGSCTRGTGTGGTALAYVTGILTNAVQITGRNGATTYTIAANFATYLGSIYIDGTNGQVSCLLSYGQSRKWGVWNAYNRERIAVNVGDGTASWTYSTATYRASNNNSANSFTAFSGLAEESVTTQFSQQLEISIPTVGGGVISINNAIGLNSTTVPSGNAGVAGLGVNGVSSRSISNGVASFILPGALGINVLNCIERGNATGTMTFDGTQTAMQMTGIWQG